jgi:hypothetical protein
MIPRKWLIVGSVTTILFVTWLITTSKDGTSTLAAFSDLASSLRQNGGVATVDAAYDKKTPPRIGCEGVVNGLRENLISTYTNVLGGIRYANIWGYLGTPNCSSHNPTVTLFD